MFKNEIKERLEKHETKILQEAVGKYAKIMESSKDFIEAYKNRDISKILYCADAINNYWNYFEIDVIEQIEKIENILTDKIIYLKSDSFYDFIDDRADYLEFSIYKIENGITKFTGETYIKEFQVERPDFPIYDFNISDINKKKKSLIEAIREDKIEPQIYVAQGESPTVTLKDK